MRWRVAAEGLARKLWHPHFAWWPRRIVGYWVWLEWIERRGTHHSFSTGGGWWEWEYRDRREKRND